MDSTIENPKKPKPAKPPAWVIDELVKKWGCYPRQVASWSPSKAFAVLYRYRDAFAKNANAARERREQLARALTLAISSEDFVTGELVDLLCESLTNLDRNELAELARGAAAFLKPPG